MANVRAAVEAMRGASGQLEQAVGEAMGVAERNLQAAEAIGQLNTKTAAGLDLAAATVEANTASTEQMAASSSELAQAIENIASVSEENSAAVEEVSACTEEMSAQVAEVTASAEALAQMAQALETVVAQFKLNRAEAAPAPLAAPRAKSPGRRALDQPAR